MSPARSAGAMGRSARSVDGGGRGVGWMRRFSVGVGDGKARFFQRDVPVRPCAVLRDSADSRHLPIVESTDGDA